MIPLDAVLTQVLHYGPEKKLYVFCHQRKWYVRDETGEHPFDPTYGKRHPHPDEGTAFMDACYETLGLYYGLPMPETGWGSEGEF